MWVVNMCGVSDSSDPPATAGHRHSPVLSKPSLLRLQRMRLRLQQGP